MDGKEFDLVKKILSVKGELDKYVILCEDEQGRYIKYAFIDGEPHDNRCLSWYDKLQPNALKRNGHDIEKWKIRDVGKLYKLTCFCCGCEHEGSNEHCMPGHPNEKCILNGFAKKWTYEEPVKCACWGLIDVDFETMLFKLTFEEIKKLINYEQ